MRGESRLSTMKRADSRTLHQYLDQEWTFDDDDDDLVAVASAIHAWAVPGDWLDLGCGPLLTVWPMFAPAQVEVWGCDKEPDIAAFHNVLRDQPLGEWPVQLLRAVTFFNRQFADSTRPRRVRTCIDRLRGVVTASVLHRQPAWAGAFDTVVQIGCFGCLDSIASLRDALKLVTEYLRPGGRFISATWTPRPGYPESERWGGIAIADMPADAMSAAVRRSGLTLCGANTRELDDAEYSHRHMIIAERSDTPLQTESN